MKIGSLITWKVDKKEFIEKKCFKNPDLEIGIVLDKKENLKSSEPGALVFWYIKHGTFPSSSEKMCWCPIDSITEI